MIFAITLANKIFHIFLLSHLSLGSLLAVYLCISATIRSLWFPNSFFSALSLATSEALGPLLFSASCTVFREDSICWKDTLCHTPFEFNTLLPNWYKFLLDSQVCINSTPCLKWGVRSGNCPESFKVGINWILVYWEQKQPLYLSQQSLFLKSLI